MAFKYNDEIVRLMKETELKIKIKIQSLDKQDRVLDEIQGICLTNGGSIHITNSDMIRRQASFQAICDNKTDIKPNSPFWINKRIKIFLGVERNKKRKDKTLENVEWFDWGIYVMSNPKNSISVNGNILNITAMDKMHMYHNSFMMQTKIKVDTPMHEAIKSLCMLMNETKYRIQENDFVIPYDQEIDPTEEIIDRMQKFQEMYMNFEICYDTDGYLCYRQTYTKPTDPCYWTFDNNSKDIEISRDINFDFNNVKNVIKVFGKYNDDTGLQPTYTLEIKDGDFSYNEIDKREICLNMDTYTKEEQCKQYAEYLAENNYKLGKQITITCRPLYFMSDVNCNIKVINGNTEYICCVDELTMPIGLGEMTITCHVIAEREIDSIYDSTLGRIYDSSLGEINNKNLGSLEMYGKKPTRSLA